MGRTEIEAFLQNRTYTGVCCSDKPMLNVERLSDKEYNKNRLKELSALKNKGKLDDEMKKYLKFLKDN